MFRLSDSAYVHALSSFLMLHRATSLASWSLLFRLQELTTLKNAFSVFVAIIDVLSVIVFTCSSIVPYIVGSLWL
ncbi:hypothetical protein D3C77_565500 [compost metagenome]